MNRRERREKRDQMKTHLISTFSLRQKNGFLKRIVSIFDFVSPGVSAVQY
jgi:hypothetical protein